MLEWDSQVLDIGRLKSVASSYRNSLLCVHSRIQPVVKTFTAHFVLYLMFLGMVSDSREISSSSVFGGRKRAVAILKILNISIIVSCTISCGTYSILASMSN